VALRRHGAVLAQERRALGTEITSLQSNVTLIERLDAAAVAHLAAIGPADTARAAALHDRLLPVVRRRRQEIVTHLAVAMQADGALHLDERRARELRRAIETATTTTLSALRTSVQASQALNRLDLAAPALRRVWDDAYAALDDVDAGERRLLLDIEANQRESRERLARRDALLHQLRSDPLPAPDGG
jgi:uncharacterized protein YaaN involved in tellurite resistance